MKTVEKLLAMFIAVTLALSVLSVANPYYLVGGFNAYADDQEDTESNSGHGSNADHDSHEQEHDQDEEECDNDKDGQEVEEDEEAESEGISEEETSEEQSGEESSNDKNEEGSEDAQESSGEDVAEDETDEQDEEDDDVNEDEDESEGESSEETEDDNREEENSGESNEEVEEENEAATEEENEEEATEEIEDEAEENNDIDEQEQAEEENDVEDEDEGCNEEEEMPKEEVEGEQESKIKWELEDTGIEVEVELKGITMAEGMYDVVFSCTEPVVSETFAGGFEVKDGEGKFETKLSLPTGTYNGCQLTIQDETIIQFDSFNVVGEVGEEVEEKRKEKRHAIVNSITGTDIHQRHLNAQPASTGNYQPGWGYTLVAAGIAEDDEDNLANAAVDIDLAVWKSNKAVILLDVLGGQIEIGDHSYTVVIGYALYGIHSDMLRINALVIDDATGDIIKMKMRGSAIAEDAEFPTDTGTLELEFDGNSGPSKNELDGWELMLDGSVAAA